MASNDRAWANLGDYVRVGELLVQNGLIADGGLTIGGDVVLGGQLTVAGAITSGDVIQTVLAGGSGLPTAGGTGMLVDVGAAGAAFITIASTGAKGLLFDNAFSVADGGVVYDAIARTMELRAGGNFTQMEVNASGVLMTGAVNLGSFGRVDVPGDFTTASAALVDVLGLTAATAAGAVYAFEANLSLNSSDVNGLQLAIDHSGAGATVEGQMVANGAGAGVLVATRISALGAALPAVVLAASDGVAKLTGIVRVGAAAGNIRVQVLKRVAGVATVYKDSYLDVKRVA